MAHEDGTAVSMRESRSRVRVRGLAVAALAAQYAPSVAVLGQWTPLRALPGVCRWQGPRFAPSVALTFDDGPDPDGTPQVLDTLDELGLRATFFVLGERARAHPGLVDEVSRRGHQLATHGNEHSRHLARSPRWIRRDLRRALETMGELGHPVAWYRPTYGQATGATLVFARLMGLETVLWSAWGREWASPGPSAVAARVARRLGPGAVVLLHDSDRFGPQGMWRVVVEALPLVAAEIRRRGLAAVTLDELVQGDGVHA